MIVDGKRKEMEPLQQALGKLRSSNTANRERGGTLCSSEEELNDLVSYNAKNFDLMLINIVCFVLTPCLSL